jgi:non-heme Fe2+,alpha-ketoglutarate-dependent halogenase
MGKILTDEALTQYRDDGYFHPVSALDSGEVARYRQALEAHETTTGGPLSGAQRNKSHLLFRWVDEIMRNETILDIAQDLLGPNILCWNTLFWIKEAHSSSFVSWHQDVRYWGLDTNDLVTIWVALSPANERSGCMRVLPGSHREAVLPHRDEYHDDNMLTRGQSIAIEVDESKTVSMPLAPGEVSIHNVQVAHASGPNETDDRRIGLSLHYIPTHVRQVVGDWDSAALVRGTDEFGHFDRAPPPSADMDQDAVAYHERASTALRDILFREAQHVRPTL